MKEKQQAVAQVQEGVRRRIMSFYGGEDMLERNLLRYKGHLEHANAAGEGGGHEKHGAEIEKHQYRYPSADSLYTEDRGRWIPKGHDGTGFTSVKAVLDEAGLGLNPVI